jgi:anti-sigma factor ChrR (cupin superfamily)
MNWHEFLDDDLRDLASLYVLGALSGDEARAYRLHLPGCDACRNEVDSLAITAGRLTLAAPAIAPPPELWPRILDSVRGPRANPRARAQRPNQVWKDWSETESARPDGILYGANDPAGFEPTGIDGITVRRLAVDRAKDQVTMIVRMGAGTAYPAHRHGGAEECFVLEGDLCVGDRHMHGGDFQRAEAGSLHPVQSTDGGCVLLIVSSTTDELVDESSDPA